MPKRGATDSIFSISSPGGRRCGLCPFGDRLADLQEHLLEVSRGDRDQHPGRSICLVLEGMQSPHRHVGEGPDAGHEALVTDEESDLAFEDVESFFLPAVVVRGRPAARRHDSFPQGVLAVGVVPHGQEAVDVPDHGDHAAFAGPLEHGSSHSVHILPPTLALSLAARGSGSTRR
jgi:hypothetical protein